MSRGVVAFVFAALLAASTAATAHAHTAFVLSSATFKSGATIPLENTYDKSGCLGKNISPELHWSGAPAATKSFALTVFDPDARKGAGWWHWVVYDMDAGDKDLHAGARPDGTEGVTSFAVPGYGGPCPPPGDAPHHYVFTLYALDERLKGSFDGPALLAAMHGHILAQAQIVGRFGR